MKVEVYRNLHKQVFSVRAAHGKVIRHASSVLLRDCTLVVQPGGRARVLATRKKNVHAFVRGTDCGAPQAELLDIETMGMPYLGLIELTYNPYKYATFVVRDAGVPVRKAAQVWLLAGRIFASEVEA